MEVNDPCRWDKYQKIWFTELKRQHIDNNVKFFLQAEAVRQKMVNIPRLEFVMVQRYRNIIIFHVGPHYINIKPWQDPHNQWLVTKFRLTKEEIDNIIREWPEEWKELVAYGQLYAKVDPRKEGTSGSQPGGPLEEYNL